MPKTSFVGYRMWNISFVGYRMWNISSVGYRMWNISFVGYRMWNISFVGYRMPKISLVGFILFPRLLALCEMSTGSSGLDFRSWCPFFTTKPLYYENLSYVCTYVCMYICISLLYIYIYIHIYISKRTYLGSKLLWRQVLLKTMEHYYF